MSLEIFSRENKGKQSTTISVPRNSHPLVVEMLCVLNLLTRVEQQLDVRPYDVRTEGGRVFRRNGRNLRSSKEPLCASTNPVADSSPGVAPTNLVPPANPMSRESSTSQEVQLPMHATKSVANNKVNSSA